MRRHTKFGRIALAATAGLVALVLSACTSTAGAKLPEQQKGGFSADVEKRLSSAVTDAMTTLAYSPRSQKAPVRSPRRSSVPAP